MSRRKLPLIILILILSASTGTVEGKKRVKTKSAVTYDCGGGRFGDKMLGYLHAKWISYKYKMPLLFRPFIYSDKLVLAREERWFKESDYSKYESVITPKKGMEVDYSLKASTLYVIPYFPDALWEHANEDHWYYFPVDWEDRKFKKLIKKLVKPLSFKPLIKLPKDRISVAVHVRLGGGFDSPDTWKKAPLKLPPIEYYKEQIRHLYELLQNQPLYIYVFTDDKNPPRLVEEFRGCTGDLDIKYDCRIVGNAHDLNVTDDFFEMIRFDCLIRPESNFSIVASKLTDYRVAISPAHFTWTGPETGRVDEVFIHYSRK